jgi:uncharacterized surface protein with fasciclin (FAS1) repeats
MEGNNSKTALIVGLIALLAIGGGTAFLLSREDTTTETETTQSQDATDSTTETAAEQNIVEIASGNEDFSTLVTAVQAAGLVETLSDETKEYTVFAPTNDAFNKLPAGTVESLVLPENKTTLSGILTYHVVAGTVLSTDLSNGQVVKTVNGADLTVEIMEGKVYLVDAKGGKAMVTTADLKANNGVIHVIDSVLMPN